MRFPDKDVLEYSLRIDSARRRISAAESPGNSGHVISDGVHNKTRQRMAVTGVSFAPLIRRTIAILPSWLAKLTFNCQSMVPNLGQSDPTMASQGMQSVLHRLSEWTRRIASSPYPTAHL